MARGGTRATAARSASGAERHLVGAPHGRSVEGLAGPLSVAPDLPSSVSAVVSGRDAGRDPRGAGEGPAETGSNRSDPGLHRRLLRRGQKGGSCVGKTKRGKGTKLMVIADGHGLPIAAGIASASPHEVTLAEATIDQIVLDHAPERLIGDRAYDSDPLDERLRTERGIEMIARHRSNRKRPKTQDGRALRRVLGRWKIERLFAWLQNYRRLVTRWEYHAENFFGFVRLGCICILLRQF